MLKYLKMYISFSFGTYLRAFLSFISTPIITYLLLPEEFGKFSIFYLYYNIVLIIVRLGLDHGFRRYYYEYNKKNRLYWSCIFPSLFISAIFSVPIIFFEKKLSILLFSEYYKYLGLLFSISVITGILQIYNQLSIRMQKKGVGFSLIETVKGASKLLIILLIIKDIPNFYSLIYAEIFSNIIALFIGFFIDKNRNFSLPEIKTIKKMMVFGFPILPADMLYWVFSSIDRFSLIKYTSLQILGIYTSAFKIVSLISLLSAPFLNFWIPISYEKYNENKNNVAFFKRVSLLVSFIFLFTGIFLIGIKNIIFLIFSPDYYNASYIFPFLLLNPVLSTILETTALGINFTKKTFWHFIILAIASIINLLGNIILVPILGAKGAAISTGLTYVILFVIKTIISEKLYFVGYNLKKIMKGINVLILIAFIGTFSESFIVNFLSSIVGLLVLCLIYKNEITQIVNKKSILQLLKKKINMKK